MADEHALYQIAVLIDDLKNEDVQHRILSMKRLQEIGQALGPERTINELLPFLNDSIDDEDDVILILAEQLGLFIPLSLATVEESTVRDKAIQSIITIAGEMSQEHVTTFIFPLVERLAKRDWYTSRISACCLIPTLYKLSQDPKKSQLLNLFLVLSKDITPLVRRSASASLSDLIQCVDKSIAVGMLHECFQQMSSDDQESVRLLSIDHCIALTSCFTLQENKDKIIPVIHQLGQDKSWRIRYSVANRMTTLMEKFPMPVFLQSLFSLYLQLLKDAEKEVRTAAVFHLGTIGSKLEVDVLLKEVIPMIQELVLDNCEYVRSALSGTLLQICPILGKERTEAVILPLFKKLLSDTNSEVRLNLLSKLDPLCAVIGITELSTSVLPAIKQLAEDPQWRVRLAIIDYIPPIARQLGKDFFSKGLSDVCLKWVTDVVFTVREQGIASLTELTKSFGDEWFLSVVLPYLKSDLSSNCHYLFRNTCLFFIKKVAPVLKASTVEKYLVPLVVEKATDPVPNVRFNVSKTAEALLPLISKEVVNSTFKPVLNAMLSDTDNDVKSFAQRAIKAM